MSVFFYCIKTTYDQEPTISATPVETHTPILHCIHLGSISQPPSPSPIHTMLFSVGFWLQTFLETNTQHWARVGGGGGGGGWGVGRARIPSRKCILLEMSEKFAENASILNRFWLRLQAPDTTQFKLSLRDIIYFHNFTGCSINTKVLKRRLIQLLVGQPLQPLSTGSKGFLDCEQCFCSRALYEHH